MAKKVTPIKEDPRKEESLLEAPAAVHMLEFLNMVIVTANEDILAIESGDQMKQRSYMIANHFHDGTATKMLAQCSVNDMMNCISSQLEHLPPRARKQFLMQNLLEDM